MNRPTPHEAMIIVARAILAHATWNVEWEDYPDIGQYDFDRIVSYAKLIAPYPDKLDEALDVLERRPGVRPPMSDRVCSCCGFIIGATGTTNPPPQPWEATDE